jgi:hypothetical protein
MQQPPRARVSLAFAVNDRPSRRSAADQRGARNRRRLQADDDRPDDLHTANGASIDAGAIVSAIKTG